MNSINQNVDLFSTSRILHEIRQNVVPVMETVLNRAGKAGCWIDMKIDPVDGSDRHLSSWYDTENIYGWIQGRGLETFTTYLRWLDTLHGYSFLDRQSILRMGDNLYQELLRLLRDRGHIPFLFADTVGYPEVAAHGIPYAGSFCDMFAARGLLEYAGYRGYFSDIPFLVDRLRVLTDLHIKGEAFNDQISFETGLPTAVSTESFGIEGPMLAIGAAEILFEATGEQCDLERGFNAIHRIMVSHTHEVPGSGLMIVDRIDREGRPVKTDGVLLNNPGHTLEIIGMGLQFLRKVPENACSSNQVDLINQWKRTFKDLADVHLGIGLSEIGTVYLSVRAHDGIPVKTASPWWSSFEAVRTACELLYISETDSEREKRFSLVTNFMQTIQKIYLERSETGVPIQTVDEKGEILNLIPATPDIDPGYHTGIPLFDAYEILSEYAGFMAGLGEVRIPLKLGRKLQGHVSRVKPADAVLDPLYARVCVLETAFSRLVVIVCDLIEFGPDWSSNIYHAIEERYGIPYEHIILASTHTHTGPCVIKLGNDRPEDELLERVIDSIHQACAASLNAMEPVMISSYQDRVHGLGINRRVVDTETRSSRMKPNPSGPIDDSVLTICLRDAEERVKGLLVNVAIHPTTLGIGISQYSADYPGRLVYSLQQKYRNAVVLVLQGACGDVRPALLNTDRTGFVDGEVKDIEYIGTSIASSIISQVDSGLTESCVLGTDLFMTKRIVTLPIAPLDNVSLKAVIEKLKTSLDKPAVSELADDEFQASHDNEALLAEIELRWAENMLSYHAEHPAPTGIEAEFGLAVIGDQIVIISVPGEIFSQIGIHAKQLVQDKSVLFCGYCGSSVGYIPTAEALREGGYEVDSAYRLYGFAGPFTSDTEPLIYSTIRELLENYNERTSVPT